MFAAVLSTIAARSGRRIRGDKRLPMFKGRLYAIINRRIPIGASIMFLNVQRGGSPGGWSMVWWKHFCKVDLGMSNLLHMRWRKMVSELSVVPALLLLLLFILLHRL